MLKNVQLVTFSTKYILVTLSSNAFQLKQNTFCIILIGIFIKIITNLLISSPISFQFGLWIF
jgi:hypothetical protein